MNKFMKIIISIFGGVDTAFSIIIPIFVALLLITTYPNLGTTNQQIILTIGFISSFYRALKVWI